MTIGVIVTGGTIASTQDDSGSGLYAPRCGSELLALTHLLGEEHGLEVVVELWTDEAGQAMPLLDSCDVNGKHWRLLSRHVDRLLERCSSVVVLHGTDTLAYTASALAMLCPRRSGPVVITGSQVPLTAAGSDAEANLRLAIDVASGDYGDLHGDTLVAFGGRVMRGVRVTKYSTSDFGGFQSFNSPVLSVDERDANPEVVKRWQIERAAGGGQPLQGFMDRVLVVRVVPGMDVSWFTRMILAEPPSGLVLELFGVGSAPEAANLAALSLDLAAIGVPTVAVSACDHGGLNWQRYEATAPLRESALIDGGDIRTEAAVVKLSGLLNAFPARQSTTTEPFAERFALSIAGESH